MIARRVATAFFLALLASGSLGVSCYGPAGRPTEGGHAMLRVRAEPEDARVSIDDRYVARAQTLAVRPRTLRPGRHLVTVEAQGYFPHDLEVDLPPGETTVEIRLRPVPP